MLTDRQLKRLQNNPPTASKRYTDGNRTGFGVQVTPSGTATFYLEYRINNKRKFPKIGKYPFMTLKKARDIAYEWRQLLEQGIDPKENLIRLEREALEREERERARVSVQDSCKSYIQYRVVGLRSEKAIVGYFTRDILPYIGEKKVDELTKSDCRNIVQRKAVNYPSMAKKILGALKQYLAWCESQEIIESNPAESIKPSHINVPGKPNALRAYPKTRVLSPEEIYCFWNGLDNSNINTTLRLALKMILVTGMRPSEVLGISMSEVNRRWWIIPAARRGKTDTSHSVYLNALALSLLKSAQDYNTALHSGLVEDPENVKLFGSGMAPGITHSLGQAVRREFKKANRAASLGEYKNKSDFFVVPASDKAKWTPHDLRRTFRTGLSEIGISDEIAEVVVGHEKRGIIGVYNKNTYKDEKREAMIRWGDYLKKIIKNDAA